MSASDTIFLRVTKKDVCGFIEVNFEKVGSVPLKSQLRMEMGKQYGDVVSV